MRKIFVVKQDKVPDGRQIDCSVHFGGMFSLKINSTLQILFSHLNIKQHCRINFSNDLSPLAVYCKIAYNLNVVGKRYAKSRIIQVSASIARKTK